MRIFAAIVLLLFSVPGKSQTEFRTVVPQNAIVVGESFQVQYVVETAEKNIQIRPPSFNNFRFVTGPYTHSGTVKGIPIQNIVFTLEAVRPGRFKIPGANMFVENRLVQTNDAWVEVISKAEAVKRFNKDNGIGSSEYFLAPGENAHEKIRQNLFIKMMVDKRTCYVGEPVLATFKLYSRLESRSDIVKNPGFYGFTVYDMVNLSDKEMTTETVNGKLFDVHTIRKVQLYPLQAGQYTVDAMMIKNQVEFSKSVVNKKTEQQIVEGVLNDPDEKKPAEGTTVYETEISTEPVTITVKPVPSKNKPDTYSGAVGRFTIDTGATSKTLKKNEEGFFEIRVSGKGNFIQLSAPEVRWPAGVEGFDPIIKDELDKTNLPLAGSRVFRYPFVCATAGTWTIPAVSFCFFDKDSNRYTTVSTKPVTVISSNEEKEKPVVDPSKKSINESSERAARVAVIIVISLVLIILAYWGLKKKEAVQEIPVQQPPPPSVDELLAPAQAAVAMEGNGFYGSLYQCIWQYASERLGISGSEMNKQGLVEMLISKGVDAGTTREIEKLLLECESGMFTNAALDHNKEELLQQAQLLLVRVDEILPKKEPVN